MSELSGLITKVKKAAEAVRAEINTLDDNIDGLNRERQTLMDAPIGKTDIMHYVADDITRRSLQFQTALKFWNKKNPTELGFAYLERNRKNEQLQMLPYLDGETAHQGTQLTHGGFYWIFGDLIAERFAAALDCLELPAETVSVDDRRKRIGEIDEELDRLISRRDDLVSQLSSVGIVE